MQKQRECAFSFALHHEVNLGARAIDSRLPWRMVRSQLPPSSRFHEGKDLKKRGEAMKQQSSVRVAVRVRPESPAREAHTSARCLVPAASNDQTVVHFHHEAQTKTFT